MFDDNSSTPEFIGDQKMEEQIEERCLSQECLETTLKAYTSNPLVQEALQLETDGMMVWGEATKAAAAVEEEEIPTAIKSIVMHAGNHHRVAAQQARSHSRSGRTRFYKAGS